MTPQAWIALIGLILATGSSVVGIAVYSSRTRAIIDATATGLDRTDHRVRNLDNWRLNLLPRELNENYARKGEMAVELRAIRESLEHIEDAIRELKAQT